MPGRRKRVFSFVLPEGVDVEAAVEALMGAVQAQFASYTVEGRRVRITLVGDPASISRSASSLKKAVKKLEAASTRSGLVRIPKRSIASFLGFPIPASLLKEALKLLGEEFEESEDAITLRHRDELYKIAGDLYKLYAEAGKLFSGKARELAALVAYFAEADLATVLQAGLDEGVFVLREEDGRAVIATGFTEALEKLLGSSAEGVASSAKPGAAKQKGKGAE